MPHRLSHGVLTWTFDPGREVHLSISDHVPLPLPGYLYLDGFEGGLDECLTCCQLSRLALLTLAVPWWEMEFGRLAWHMGVAHMISRTMATCWRSPLISGLVQLIWLAFGWLLWDLQRLCRLTLWMLLISRWNLSSVAWDWRQVVVHMTSQIVTSCELCSGLTSFRLLADICLPNVFDVWQMVQVIPTPERWNPTPHGMVCVVELLCGGCSGWAHVTRFLQCPESPVTSAFGLGLESWDVMNVFLPTSLPSASLVGSGLSVWLEWWWLLAAPACHWVRSRDRTVHKFVRERNALSRTNGWGPALCAVFSLSWFAFSCCLLDTSYPVDSGSRCTVFQDT